MSSNPRDDNRVPNIAGVANTSFTGSVVPAVTANHELVVLDQVAASLVPTVYDYISLTYTGSNLTTVVFKLGGSGGTTISTLTLGYDGSNNLTSVTKT